MFNIWSYPKIRNLGHKEIDRLLDGPVHIQEKYDGSQFSFAWVEGELFVRSKGKQQYGAGAVPDKMFQPAIDYLLTLPSIDGLVFRAEILNSEKHNTLKYGRQPRNGIVLFDVERLDTPQSYLSSQDIYDCAEEMGIVWAQTLVPDVEMFDDGEGDYWVEGKDLTLDKLTALLERESSLGGTKVEGIVLKNYTQFTKGGSVMMGKLVSEEFREVHKKSWKGRNLGQKDFIQGLIDSLNTEARWLKAVQHLEEDGTLVGAPEDIGPLMVEVKRDVVLEEWEWIQAELTRHFLPQIARGLGRGLPEWWKARLAEEAFDG